MDTSPRGIPFRRFVTNLDGLCSQFEGVRKSQNRKPAEPGQILVPTEIAIKMKAGQDVLDGALSLYRKKQEATLPGLQREAKSMLNYIPALRNLDCLATEADILKEALTICDVELLRIAVDDLQMVMDTGLISGAEILEPKAPTPEGNAGAPPPQMDEPLTEESTVANIASQEAQLVTHRKFLIDEGVRETELTRTWDRWRKYKISPPPKPVVKETKKSGKANKFNLEKMKISYNKFKAEE